MQVYNFTTGRATSRNRIKVYDGQNISSANEIASFHMASPQITYMEPIYSNSNTMLVYLYDVSHWSREETRGYIILSAFGPGKSLQ